MAEGYIEGRAEACGQGAAHRAPSLHDDSVNSTFSSSGVSSSCSLSVRGRGTIRLRSSLASLRGWVGLAPRSRRDQSVDDSGKTNATFWKRRLALLSLSSQSSSTAGRSTIATLSVVGLVVVMLPTLSGVRATAHQDESSPVYYSSLGQLSGMVAATDLEAAAVTLPVLSIKK